MHVKVPPTPFRFRRQDGVSNKFTGLVVVRRVLGGYLAHPKVSVRDAPVLVFSRSERKPKV